MTPIYNTEDTQMGQNDTKMIQNCKLYDPRAWSCLGSSVSCLSKFGVILGSSRSHPSCTLQSFWAYLDFIFESSLGPSWAYQELIDESSKNIHWSHLAFMLASSWGHLLVSSAYHVDIIHVSETNGWESHNNCRAIERCFCKAKNDCKIQWLHVMHCCRGDSVE